MAQSTDIILSDQLGAPFRAELNQILSALGTDNSGNSEPLNTYQFMKWVDTSNATYYYVKERNHDNTAWVTLFRYTVATKIMEAVSGGVVLTDMTAQIHASSSKTTPVDADEIGLIDSASTFTLKKLTWANLKATLKTYFDTLYQATLVSGTNIKTINSNSILGSGNIVVGETEWTANDTRAKTALNATGTAPIYACRAWVNFNGTGAVAIRASGNVSSITDNGTGYYTVNFTTAMPDANYSCVWGHNRGVVNVANQWVWCSNILSTSVTLNVYQGVYVDTDNISCSIFR